MSLQERRQGPVSQLSIRAREGRLSSEAVAALNADLAARFGNRFTASEAIRQAARAHPDLARERAARRGGVRRIEGRRDRRGASSAPRHDAPIVPFGTGTSLEGHVNAPHGGVSLDCSRMNQVLAVNADDLDCVVEPGVTRKQLNEHLRDTGLFFPIDPGADASIGGMAATRASGTNAVRYGTMKDVVLSLGVVTADGSFLRTGTRAKKSSAGYDLTHLFVGSEGTLGVDRRDHAEALGDSRGDRRPGPARFPTCARPARRRSRRSSPACRSPASSLSMRSRCAPSTPMPSSRCPSSRCCWSSSTAPRRASPSRRGASARSPPTMAAGRFAWATRPEERNKLWQARHDGLLGADGACGPAHVRFATDVCVPISRLADCVDETLADIERRGLVAPIVGHVGDGNFHVSSLIDMENPAEIDAAKASPPASPIAPSPWAAPAPASTASARRRAPTWRRSTARSALDLMRRVKASFDPQNLFNPGKVVLRLKRQVTR